MHEIVKIISSPADGKPQETKTAGSIRSRTDLRLRDGERVKNPELGTILTPDFFIASLSTNTYNDCR